jgi:hypothetical protein
MKNTRTLIPFRFASLVDGCAHLITVRLRFLIFLIALLFCVSLSSADDDLAKYAVWITGDVYLEGKVVLFRADKAVQGNSTGNVVLLGATKQTINVLGPLYVKAAQQHMKLRLYGVLVPTSDATSAKASTTPSVQFITWKLHLPSDPDALPDDAKITIKPGDSLEGFTVKPGSK